MSVSFARQIDGSSLLSLASVPDTLDTPVTIVNYPVTIVHGRYIVYCYSSELPVESILSCVLLVVLAVVTF